MSFHSLSGCCAAQTPVLKSLHLAISLVCFCCEPTVHSFLNQRPSSPSSALSSLRLSPRTRRAQPSPSPSPSPSLSCLLAGCWDWGGRLLGLERLAAGTGAVGCRDSGGWLLGLGRSAAGTGAARAAGHASLDTDSGGRYRLLRRRRGHTTVRPAVPRRPPLLTQRERHRCARRHPALPAAAR